MKTYKFKIKFVTPVHIGDGEEVEPFNYILKENVFYRINLEKFIFELSDGGKIIFNSLVDKTNIIELRRFIKDNCSTKKYTLYSAKTEPSFRQEYEKSFKNLNNKLTVNSFIKTGNYMSFIPGSSLKGSIRTAILNFIMLKDKLSDRDIANSLNVNSDNRYKTRINGKNVENKILKMQNNDPKNDPFRFFSITDYSLEKNELCIGKVSNIRFQDGEKSENSKSWMMFYEVPLNKNEGDTDFKFGEIRFDTEIQKKLNNFTEFNNIDFIKEACNWFYGKIAKEEYEKFYKNDPNISRTVYKNYLEINDIKKDEMLLRVGKNSQFESMTFVGFDWLKPKKRGNSRNLFENKMPIGWMKLTLS
ncbi:MAG: type III-A CRISPR-associated RAMP protein Csm5 [Candidatus Humimicrobiaceae bacterium]